MRRLGTPDRDLVTLWLPVVGVAALTQARLGLEQPWTGSDLALAVTALALSLPLLVRRRAPLATTGAIAAALPLQATLGGSLSFGTFVALLVAAYTAGRHATPARAVAGGVLLLLGVLLVSLDELSDTAAELLFPLFYVTAATSLGAVVRRLVAQAAQLQALNTALARERDATVRLATAGERMRLARDLHDSVAHTLTVMVVQAQSCEQAVDDDPAAARAAAAAVAEAGRRGLAELRAVVRVVRDLDTPVAEPTLADLPALAGVMAETGLRVDVRTDGDPALVPEPVASELFRVVQESLTNTVRHSAAESAVVTVGVADGVAEVTVADPGPARDPALPSGGHGLTGMGERLARLGGRVEAGPSDGGFVVRARVPLEPRRPDSELSAQVVPS